MFDLMPWQKRTPKRVVRFRNELDDLFSRFFDVNFPSPGEFFKGFDWYPSVDVGESDNIITIKAEIPGVDVKDIDLKLEGQVLTIKGEKKQEKEEKEENYHHTERSYGYFQRRVELPAEVDPDKVEAAYKKGILTVKLIKTKESATKRIEIKS